jgi:transposase
MEILKLSGIVADREQLITYLQNAGLLYRFEECPHCHSRKIGHVRREKLKCYDCRKEWSIRRGSIFERMKIPLEKFFMALKLFEMEISGLKAAEQLGITHVTTMGLYDLFREIIYRESLPQGDNYNGEIELDESYFGGRRKGNRGRGAAGKIPVFGILERDGKVTVEVVRDVTAESLLTLTIRKVKRGSMIYTDRYRSYDGLLSLGFKHKRVDHSKTFGNGRVYINGIEGFWSYAKGRLQKYHGVSKEKFPLYLKELEYRYNHREADFFDLMIENLKDYTLVACSM